MNRSEQMNIIIQLPKYLVFTFLWILLGSNMMAQTLDYPIVDTDVSEDPDGYAGQYPYFWTSTTHKDGINPYSSAVYIAFGEAKGIMIEKLLDVHGAGAQRSDPKSGDINNYPQFFGPQGDVRYVYNAVRCEGY